jgi:DNA-binding MarR family transcriptional regulator
MLPAAPGIRDDDVLRPSGLRVTQFSILAAMARMGEANLRQLEDTLAIDQTTLTRSIKLLERESLVHRAPHADGRIKAMLLSAKGRRALKVARPLWARAQARMIDELGPKTWVGAQRWLAHARHAAVTKRREATRGRSPGPGG